jgi:sugar (pentulose or hexulose) kinase
MLIVGTDRMTVAGTSGAPEGPRHAVDQQGRVLCRNTRPRFAWPALAWEDHRGEAACQPCAQVRSAQEAMSQLPAYPVEASSPAGGIVAWQLPVAMFEPSDL